MLSSIGSSLSGMQAASKRLEVAAQNLANQNSVGYKPQRVAQTSEGGAVKANVETVANPTQKIYYPDSPQADEYGFIDAPNVDTARELVELKIASYDYKANAKAIKVEGDLQQYLLDILS